MLLGGTASAEVSIDLSSMSLDELVELHKLLDAEIDARIGGEPSMIAGGVYTAGETIKAGAYVITFLNQYKDDYQLFAGHIQPGQPVLRRHGAGDRRRRGFG